MGFRVLHVFDLYSHGQLTLEASSYVVPTYYDLTSPTSLLTNLGSRLELEYEFGF
jgi:hypothetical protein